MPSYQSVVLISAPLSLGWIFTVVVLHSLTGTTLPLHMVVVLFPSYPRSPRMYMYEAQIEIPMVSQSSCIRLTEVRV